MGNRRYKVECFHMLGMPESERLKVIALNLWEASRLLFDRPLPGKPPTQPPLSFSRGRGEGEGRSFEFGIFEWGFLTLCALCSAGENDGFTHKGFTG
jgi:hypothetical protein